MLLSFILHTTSIEPKSLEQWLKNIFAEKKYQFQVVVVDDSINHNNLLILGKYFALYPTQLIIITNYQVAGIVVSRNLGLKYATGKYVIILNPTELTTGNFISTIFNILTNNDNLDCIEYRVKYEFETNIFHSTIRVNAEEIYHLNTAKGSCVYALTSPLLSTKVMKRKIINEYNLQFRKEIHFDSLFLYSFLTHCKTYYAINNTLVNCTTSLLENDNTFDLMNQWIHILNYYNNYQIKKTLQNELEYAVIRYYLYTLLRFISITNKPILSEKAYNRIKETIEFKFKNFKNNPYLNTVNKADIFTTYALDFSKYFKKYFKDNNIRDDSRYWE